MTNAHFIRLLRILCLAVMLIDVPVGLKAQSIPAWQVGVAYTVGQEVSYNGNDYDCLQAHTSEPGWDPVDAPALWQLVGSGGGQCTAAPSAPTGLTASGT